jgi:hypothetical protein
LRSAQDLTEPEIRDAVLALGEERRNVEAGATPPIAILPRLCCSVGFDRDRPVVCVGSRRVRAEWVSGRVLEVESMGAFVGALNVSSSISN